MSEPKTIRAYLETVAAQIRWKRARAVVTAELEQHLEDQRDAFAAEGAADPEALAVEEMGDPVSVGTELDSLHRPQPQWGPLLFTMALALAGALLRVWLTAGQSSASDPLRAAASFLLGCGALLAGYLLDYARLARRAGAICAGTLIAGALILSLSPRVNNGLSYFAQYAALFYPVAYALWLYACRGKGWPGVGTALLGGVPLAALCMMTPSLFGLGLLLVSGFVLWLAAAWDDWFGVGRWKAMAVPLVCAGAAVGMILYLVVRYGWMCSRLLAAFHPELDPYGTGYQALGIRQALDVSQWLGQGLWSQTALSCPYERAVPAWDSDGLLTTLIYRTGWLPFLAAVLALCVLLAFLGLRCRRCRGQLGRAVVLAVLATLGLQAFFSVVWNMGYPLFSSAFPLMVGNLNTVADMGLIGLALSVFREERIARDPACPAERPPRYRIKVTIQKVSD